MWLCPWDNHPVWHHWILTPFCLTYRSTFTRHRCCCLYVCLSSAPGVTANETKAMKKREEKEIVNKNKKHCRSLNRISNTRRIRKKKIGGAADHQIKTERTKYSIEIQNNVVPPLTECLNQNSNYVIYICLAASAAAATSTAYIGASHATSASARNSAADDERWWWR